MRTILVFPPQANPTYTPLGIASLAAFIRQEEPGCEIEVLNANIIAWEWVAERTPGGVDTLRFYRGLEGDFFQQEAYLARQGGRQALESAWKSLEARLQHRQATGAADAEIEAPLNLLVNRILRQDPELVGFSIFSFSQLRWALTLAEMIRGTGAVSGRKGPRIILGGAACAAVSVRDVLQSSVGGNDNRDEYRAGRTKLQMNDVAFFSTTEIMFLRIIDVFDGLWGQ